MPKAIVMGGSLGGLSAALYLREAGFDVRVFERSIEPLEGQGAGIVLNPYTVRYLTDHNAIDVEAISVSTSYLRYIDGHNNVVAEVASPYRFASYTSLYSSLLSLFGTENYHLSQRVISFEQMEKSVSIHTAQGIQEDSDLLVCADGIGSDARLWLMGETSANYSGYIAWRGIIGEANVSNDALQLLEDAIIYHILPDGHLLTYPIPAVENGLSERKRYINWLWYRNVPAGHNLEVLMTDVRGTTRNLSVAPGSVVDEQVAQLKADAKLLPNLLRQLIELTEHPFIQAVYDYEITQMAFGRVCIIGDAAFSVRPHTATGTAKAVEDARQLGLSLSMCHNDVSSALTFWEDKQLKLGQELVRRSRKAGTKLQDGTWPVGAPLAFGLYEQGDSEML